MKPLSLLLPTASSKSPEHALIGLLQWIPAHCLKGFFLNATRYLTSWTLCSVLLTIWSSLKVAEGQFVFMVEQNLQMLTLFL